ncbi:MAG: phosphonate ABC transporter, permease protein PhnE [Candidatus Riflebacteria bacterium RBG_13_59_9]|nr:MAG: phosphonate ABC transporter, permease protein PhnE [Candidatus Riflebacteria bacterium RBG_13_59_9]
MSTEPTGAPSLPRRPARGGRLAGLLRWLVLLALVAYVALAVQQTEFNPLKLISGAKSAGEILAQIIHPDWSILPRLVVLMNETVEIALLGTLLAIVISFPLSFLAAKNLMLGSTTGSLVYASVRLVFNVLRAFEPVMLGLVFVLMVGIGPFPGVLALGLHSVGMLGKLFSESIEDIDPGPVEAVEACGGNRFQVIWYGILPQVAPSFLAFSIYRWDINIRMSIILGIVGAGGIGFMLIQYLNMFQYRKFSTAFILILLVVTVLDYASAWLRTRLGQK